MTDRTETNGSRGPEVPEKARRRRFEAEGVNGTGLIVDAL